jgi:hypothetical protein
VSPLPSLLSPILSPSRRILTAAPRAAPSSGHPAARLPLPRPCPGPRSRPSPTRLASQRAHAATSAGPASRTSRGRGASALACNSPFPPANPLPWTFAPKPHHTHAIPGRNPKLRPWRPLVTMPQPPPLRQGAVVADLLLLPWPPSRESPWYTSVGWAHLVAGDDEQSSLLTTCSRVAAMVALAGLHMPSSTPCCSAPLPLWLAALGRGQLLPVSGQQPSADSHLSPGAAAPSRMAMMLLACIAVRKQGRRWQFHDLVSL